MSITTRVSRVSLTGAGLVVAGVLVAGCSTTSSGPAAAGAPPSGSSASVTSSSPAAGGTGTEAATTGPGTAASTPSATPSPTGPAGSSGGSSACTTGDLKTTTGEGGGGAAGSFYSVIDFTNTSSASCTLYGYPGVSLRGANSAQIGAAATRTLTPGPGLVTLAPGATAHATLKMVDATVYPASECGPVTSASLLVYPPNQTQSVQIPFQGQACSNSAVKILAVSAVTSGSLG